MKITKDFINKILRKIYLYAWMSLAISIPISQIFTSISLFTIAGAWLLMGDFDYKASQIRAYIVPFLCCLGVFVLFAFGLWNTENWAYALHDLKIKLPLLAIPILITTGPKLSSKQLRWVFYFLAIGALLSATIGYVKGTFFSSLAEYNFRSLSPFISHIRLSLMLCFSLALFYDVMITGSSKWRWLLLFPIGFILFYVNLIQSLTSLVILFLIFTYILFFYHPWKYAKLLGITSICLFVFVVLFGTLKMLEIYEEVNQEVKYPIDVPFKNSNGRTFEYNFEDRSSENGNPISYFICKEELYAQWPKVSKVHLDSLVNNYPLYNALIRYLTSRGLTKDSLGISELSPFEIESIEKGVANVFYLRHSGMENRIHQTFWEIKNWKMGANTISNSVAMRLFFWQNAKEIIVNHFFTGVGLGDVQDVITAQYQKGRYANEDEKLRSHNQYLTVFISHGIFGFILFITLMLYPVIQYKGEFKFLFLMAGLIILTSMLWEDTLETQAGASVAALLLYLPFLNWRTQKES